MRLTSRFKWCFLLPVEMKTSYTKSMKHAPMASGITGVCQRDSRLFGIVGMKF
jgi:hypothetical protein